MENLEKDIEVLSEKARFLKAIITKKLKIANTPKKEVVGWLETNKFKKQNSSYDYLIGMPIHNLTKEKYEEFLKLLEKKKLELKEISEKKPIDMYLEDLRELKKEITKSL